MRIHALLALLVAAVVAAAELPFTLPAAYACDVAFVDGEQKGTGRLAVDGKDKQRMDMKTDQGQMVVIMRRDTKQMHMLMVAEKMYMTMPFDEAKAKVDPTMDPTATFTKEGTEAVGGVTCDRYAYTGKDGAGKAWVDAKRNVLIQVKSDGGATANFSNYTIGAQKADLFEIPKDFQQMPGMGGMMGGQ